MPVQKKSGNLLNAPRMIAATIVKQSKEKSWEEFGQKLDTDYISANEH